MSWPFDGGGERFVSAPEWKQAIKERTGAEPIITYFESPVIVDNAVGEIESAA